MLNGGSFCPEGLEVEHKTFQLLAHRPDTISSGQMLLPLGECLVTSSE